MSITFYPKSGNFSINRDEYKGQDPYINITVDGITKANQPDYDAGLNARWKEKALTFQVTSSTREVLIEAVDWDGHEVSGNYRYSQDDLIGSSKIGIETFTENGEASLEIELRIALGQYDTGSVVLGFSYTPKGSSQGGKKNTGYGHQQHAKPQQNQRGGGQQIVPRDPSDPNIGKKIGDWVMQKHLGSGSYGDVYLGTNKNGETCAVKRILKTKLASQKEKEMFITEIKIMKK